MKQLIIFSTVYKMMLIFIFSLLILISSFNSADFISWSSHNKIIETIKKNN